MNPGRQAVVVGNGWDENRVTLIGIETMRDAAAEALRGFFKGFGYV